MHIRISSSQMEDIEGLGSEYPYAYHRTDLAATVVPWHWHEALEFGYVVSGCVKVITVNGNMEFGQGQGFFMNGSVLAAMEQRGGCVLESHLFHPVFLAGHFKSVFETKYLQPVTQNRRLELVPIPGEREPQRQMLRKLRELSALQREENKEFQTRNLLSEIWLLLLEEVKQSGIGESRGAVRRSQERVLTMMAFVQENCGEKITLEEIAASASVSTRECLRCFQSSIHQSPMEYLIACRVGKAARLLERTELSVTEIALRTGFGSPAYFSKIFRRETGKTPVGYRKAAEKQKAE